jgi:hypothetical protein
VAGQPKQTFDEQKFRDMVVRIADALGPRGDLGRVKLAKLLMLSDFTAFRSEGRSISGATYEKWPFGHLPSELIMAEKDMEAAEEIEIETVDFHGNRMRRVTSTGLRGQKHLSKTEQALVDGVIVEHGDKSAKQLSAQSHREIGWRIAALHEPIPYFAGLLGRKRPPKRVFEHFRKLHDLK